MINFAQRLEKFNRFNFNENWKNWMVRMTYILLQQTDLVLTTYAVSHGFIELNPFMHGVISSLLLLILIKAVIPLLIALFIPSKLLMPACGLLLFVNVWDIFLLIV